MAAALYVYVAFGMITVIYYWSKAQEILYGDR